MAQKGLHENDMASFTLRHRAVCKEGDLKSKWQSDINVARSDAAAHQEEHHDHEIRIVTEQSMSMMFTG